MRQLEDSIYDLKSILDSWRLKPCLMLYSLASCMSCEWTLLIYIVAQILKLQRKSH